MRRIVVLTGVVCCFTALVSFAGAAEPKVHPKIFVGGADACGAGYPAGSPIVTAGWVKGIGLPDNGALNSGPLCTTGGEPECKNNPDKTDNRYGLLLSKNGHIAECSAAGAELTGVNGITLTEMGYDIHNGTHCGAGAPRFNVFATDGFTLPAAALMVRRRRRPRIRAHGRVCESTRVTPLRLSRPSCQVRPS